MVGHHGRGLEEGLEVADVPDGEPEGLYFRELLSGWLHVREALSEELKGLVHVLHPSPFPVARGLFVVWEKEGV